MANNVTGASLQDIYERLNNVSRYHPFEAKTFADPSMEAGDMVTISRDGSNYESPVGTINYKWKKGIEADVSSTGKQKRDSLSKTSSKKYRGGSSGLRNTHYMHLYVDDKYNQMRSGLELTGSSASLYVRDIYRQLKSGLDLTSSTASLYVRDMYNQMRSGLDLTSSSASLYVEDMYRQMKAGLDLTSSSASLYVRDLYNQMKSGLDLTSSSASLYVENMYSQMKAGLDLTSSSASLYVRDLYNQMSSGLDLTSSSASLYVQNMYKQMTAGLKLSASAACLYAKSRTSKAEIIARINESGESEALINADRVKISGTTTINDIVTISDSRVKFKKALWVEDDARFETLTLRDRSSTSITLNESKLESTIVGASVSNNVLTLTTLRGNTVNFSKATTLAQDDWSSGHLHVYGTQTNYNTSTHQNETTRVCTLDRYLIDSGEKQNLDGTAYTTGNNEWYVPVKAKTSANTSTSVATGLRIHVNATAIRTAGQNDVTLTSDGWTYNGDNVSTNSRKTNSYVVKTSGRPSQLTHTININMTAGSFSTSTNKAIVYTRNGTSSSGAYVAMLEVDASTIRTAGKNDVTLNDFTYYYDAENVDTNNRTSNRVTVTTNGRPTQLSKSVDLIATGGSTWSNNETIIYVRKGSQTGEYFIKKTVSCAGPVSSARTAGQNDVTLNRSSWYYGADQVDLNAATGNTITISTVGRPSRLSESVGVYLTNGSWSNNEMIIYVRDGGYDGPYVLKKVISCQSEVSTALNNVTVSVDASMYSSNNAVCGVVGSTSNGKKSGTMWLYLTQQTSTVYLTKDGWVGGQNAVTVGKVSLSGYHPTAKYYSVNQLTNLNSSNDGAMALYDRNGRAVAGGNSYYWYYRGSYAATDTFYT